MDGGWVIKIKSAHKNPSLKTGMSPELIRPIVAIGSPVVPALSIVEGSIVERAAGGTNKTTFSEE